MQKDLSSWVVSERQNHQSEKAEVLLVRARLRHEKELSEYDEKLFKRYKVTEAQVSAALAHWVNEPSVSSHEALEQAV